MRKIIVLIIVLFTLSCNSLDCKTLPNSYESYSKAIALIEQTTFNFTDEVDTSSSSWIRKANYYSCDNSTGYLIIETDSENYIHQDVPIAVWKEFKDATSFGRYYNSHFKGSYKLTLGN